MVAWSSVSTRRVSQRGLTTLVVFALLIGALAVPASAGHYQASLEGSAFEIEDNANIVFDDTASTDLDWGNVSETRDEDAATGKGDDSYAGGVKEDTSCPGETTGSIPNNKSDLRWFGLHHEVGTAPGDDGFLHLFWTRVADPSGTTLMDFEFNQSQTPCGQGPNVTRMPNDMLIEYSIEGGGARATMTIRRWSGSAWGAATMFSANEATGTVNTQPIAAADSDGLVPSGESTQARTFGEASIDLDTVFNDALGCQSFGSAMLKSRSSDSFTSQLKDFIEPVPITLSNCGSLQIRKTDGGGNNLAGAKFKVYEDVAPLDTFASPPDIQVNNSAGLGECTTTATLGIGNCFYTNLLIGKSYYIVETEAPTGFQADTTPRRVTINSTALVTSTWVNQPSLGNLTVTKQDDAGNLMDGVTFTLTGQSTAGASVNQSCVTSAGTCSILNVPVGTNYTLAESTIPAGYGADSTFPRTGVTITSGQTVQVSATNPRLHKVIVIVCHQGTNTLAPSGVTLGSDSLTTIGSPPSITGATAPNIEAALCALQGFAGQTHGSQSPAVNVGSGHS